MLKKFRVCIIITIVCTLMIFSLKFIREPARSSVMRGFDVAKEMGCFATSMKHVRTAFAGAAPVKVACRKMMSAR